MNKIDKLERHIVRLENEISKRKKPFKLPFRAASVMKKSKKQKDSVLVLYLTQKYEAQFLMQKVISGNLVVVANKVHVLNPKEMWSFGKYRFYVIREIDRKPVSNEDYDAVKIRRDNTDEDVPLIKAVLGAIQKEGVAAKNKNIIVAVIIIAIIGAIAYFIFGGGAA